tara:strand:- start:384 stop:731 length:348 start_codon:yes stop_codon:yes gene_type:complete
MRTVDEIKKSIKELIIKAENSFEDNDQKEIINSDNINNEQIPNDLDSLPLEIKEEIKNEFTNFQKAFENQDIDDILSQTIRETTKNVLDEWLKINLPNIVRDVVDEKINKLTKKK